MFENALPIVCVLALLVKNFLFKNKLSHPMHRWISATVLLFLIPQIMTIQSDYSFMQYRMVNITIVVGYWVFAAWKYYMFVQIQRLDHKTLGKYSSSKM